MQRWVRVGGFVTGYRNEEAQRGILGIRGTWVGGLHTETMRRFVSRKETERLQREI